MPEFKVGDPVFIKKLGLVGNLRSITYTGSEEDMEEPLVVRLPTDPRKRAYKPKDLKSAEGWDVTALGTPIHQVGQDAPARYSEEEVSEALEWLVDAYMDLGEEVLDEFFGYNVFTPGSMRTGASGAIDWMGKAASTAGGIGGSMGSAAGGMVAGAAQGVGRMGAGMLRGAINATNRPLPYASTDAVSGVRA